MHTEALDYVTTALAHARESTVVRHVVDIGGRDVNGSPRGAVIQCFPQLESYVSVDKMPGPGVDVIADGRTFLPRVPPDVVLCCEVLEHCAQPEALVTHAIEMLRPGGWFIMTCAGEGRLPHSGIHGGPLVQNEHYRNITVAELEAWLAPVAAHWQVSTNDTTHDLYCTVRKGE